MASYGGGVSFIPPEYYGLVGLGNAARDVGQTFQEQKRYEKSEERKDLQEANQKFMVQWQALEGMNASDETKKAILRDYIGSDTDIKLNFNIDAALGDIAGKYISSSPEERSGFDPFVKSLAFEALTGSALDPVSNQEMVLSQLDKMNLEVEGLDLSNIIQQAGWEQFQGLEAQANDFLSKVGARQNGVEGFKLWTETQKSPLLLSQLDAQTKASWQELDINVKRMALLDQQIANTVTEAGYIGPEAEMLTSKASLLAERLTSIELPYILDYMMKKDVPPGIANNIRAAELAMQREIVAKTQAAWEEAEAAGDAVLLDNLKSYAVLLDNLSELGLSESGAALTPMFVDLAKDFSNRYIPGATKWIKSDPNWLAREFGAQPEFFLETDVGLITGIQEVAREQSEKNIGSELDAGSGLFSIQADAEELLSKASKANVLRQLDATIEAWPAEDRDSQELAGIRQLRDYVSAGPGGSQTTEDKEATEEIDSKDLGRLVEQYYSIVSNIENFEAEKPSRWNPETQTYSVIGKDYLKNRNSKLELVREARKIHKAILKIDPNWRPERGQR